MPRLPLVAALVLALGSSLGACGATDQQAAPDRPTASSAAGQHARHPHAHRSPRPSHPAPASRARPGPRPDPALGTVPPPWLGTRPLPRAADGYGVVRPTPPALRDRRFTLPDTVPMLPGTGFASRVVAPAPADVIARSTWKPGCPVAASDLAWLRLTFWGFDDHRHTGEMLVNRRVASDLVSVFHQLYDARFPIEQMLIVRALGGKPTGDGNGTGSFVCRPTTGQTSGFSQHAYGLAVDINTFQNPYVKGARVLPELASAYLDRSRNAPGMIHPGDVVTRAFASIGWGWGGSWSSLKDYQHFSANGR